MSRVADVIHLWSGEHEKRIRIPGPGEQSHEAQIIILPVVHRSMTKPPRKPRTKQSGKNP